MSNNIFAPPTKEELALIKGGSDLFAPPTKEELSGLGINSKINELAEKAKPYLKPVGAALAAGAREQTAGLSKKLERGLGYEQDVDKLLADYPLPATIGRVGSYFTKLSPFGLLGSGITKGIGAVANYAPKGLGLLAQAAAIPAELGAQAAAGEGARRLIGEEGTGQDFGEFVKEAATDPVSLGLSGLLRGSAAAIKTAKLPEKLYSATGAVDKDMMQRYARQGIDPRSYLMEKIGAGSTSSLQGKADELAEAGLSGRKQILRNLQEQSPDYIVPERDVLGKLRERIEQKNKTPGASQKRSSPNEPQPGYAKVADEAYELADIPGGYSLGRTEELRSNIGRELRAAKGADKTTALFSGEAGIPAGTTEAQRDLLSTIAKAQRTAIGEKISPKEAERFSALTTQYGLGSEAARNLEEEAAKSGILKNLIGYGGAGIGLPGLVYGAAMGNPYTAAGGATLLGLSQLASNPRVQSGAAVGLKKLTENGPSATAISEAIRQNLLEKLRQYESGN